MSDIKFECPDCSQHITAPDEMIGMEVDCPGCARKVKVRRQEPRPVFQTQPPSPVKQIAVHSKPFLVLVLVLGCAIVFVQYQQARALSRMAQKAAAPQWEYKVVACEDYTSEMDKYERRQLEAKKISEDQYFKELESNSRYYNGRFDYLQVSPGPDWEVCAWFLEPRTEHAKLILIFKRPI